MDFLRLPLENAVLKHGSGTLLLALEALCRAHSVHTEQAPHGFFMKVFFEKQSRRTVHRPTMHESLAKPMTPPGLRCNSSGDDDKTHGALARGTLLALRPQRLKVKKTFIHVDSTEEGSHDSQGSIWSAPGNLQTHTTPSKEPEMEVSPVKNDPARCQTDFFDIGERVHTAVQTEGCQPRPVILSSTSTGCNTIKPELHDKNIQVDAEMASQEVQTSSKELPAAPIRIPEGSSWQPLACKELQIGDIVKTQKQIWSGNISASIKQNRVGKVAEIDNDMDASIIFPGEDVEDHWVLKTDFQHLVMLHKDSVCA